MHPQRKSASRQRSMRAVLLAIFAMSFASCQTPSGKPTHCVTKEEYPNYALIAEQKYLVHQTDLVTGRATRFVEYAEWVAYLQERCMGINAFRGEGGAE